MDHLLWNSYTEHSEADGSKFENDMALHDNHLYSKETVGFLATMSNILLFRRNGIKWIENMLEDHLKGEFRQKITLYTTIHGSGWRNCMMFLSVYAFSPKLENALNDLRNTVKSILLMAWIVPYENFSGSLANIVKDIKILLKYDDLMKYSIITTYDVGCSSHSESEFAWIVSKLMRVNFDTCDINIDTFCTYMLTIKNRYQALTDLSQLCAGQIILANEETQIVNSYEKSMKLYTECKYYTIPNRIHAYLLNKHIMPRFNTLFYPNNIDFS